MAPTIQPPADGPPREINEPSWRDPIAYLTLAAAELHRTTGDAHYAGEAARLAAWLIGTQERSFVEGIPSRAISTRMRRAPVSSMNITTASRTAPCRPSPPCARPIPTGWTGMRACRSMPSISARQDQKPRRPSSWRRSGVRPISMAEFHRRHAQCRGRHVAGLQFLCAGRARLGNNAVFPYQEMWAYSSCRMGRWTSR